MCVKTNNLGSDQVRHKPSCTVTEDGERLEILDLERRVAKTKALISFVATCEGSYVIQNRNCLIFAHTFDTNKTNKNKMSVTRLHY